MDEHHRKIDLQSPADLTYLRDNIRAAAREKIDLAIPPQGEDAFRTKVQQLVQDYITSTLTLALPSLTLNGLDPSPTLVSHPDTTQPSADDNDAAENDANYEPYDPRLAARLRELYAQLEHESTRVAELRRDAPGAAARAYMERLEGEMGAERELKREEDVDEGMGVVLEAGMGEEVERMWGRGVEGLVGLERITEVLAKLERAGKAAEVVEGM